MADDGTAASFNPAGLAELRRTEIALVGFTETLTSRVTRPGTTLDTRATHRRPDFFGIAVPFEAGGRNLTVQLSYQLAVDLFGKGTAAVIERSALEEVHPDLPPVVADFVERVATEQAGAFHTLSLSAGYQLTSRLSLGTSVNYWFGDWMVDGTNEVTLLGDLPRGSGPIVQGKVFDLDFNQQQSMRAVSVNLGFLLKYARVSVGGVARLPFSGNYDLSERDVTVQSHPAAAVRCAARPPGHGRERRDRRRPYGPRHRGGPRALRLLGSGVRAGRGAGRDVDGTPRGRARARVRRPALCPAPGDAFIRDLSRQHVRQRAGRLCG